MGRRDVDASREELAERCTSLRKSRSERPAGAARGRESACVARVTKRSVFHFVSIWWNRRVEIFTLRLSAIFIGFKARLVLGSGLETGVWALECTIESVLESLRGHALSLCV